MKLDEELPSNKRHVWIAASILTVFVVVLYLADLYLSKLSDPSKVGWISLHIPILRSLIENAMAGAVAAFLLAIFYRWIVEAVDPRDRVVEIKPDAVNSRLLKNARASGSYVFIGNTATFVCASILPILCARAHKTGRSIDVEVFVIDPRREDVLSSYVSYKNRMKASRGRVADADLATWTRPVTELVRERELDAKAKLYACIYLCAYASTCAGISVRLYFRSSFTPFRADISDREVILTQESISDSAVAFSSAGHFYGWYQKEADALAKQCEKIDFSDKSVNLRDLAHPTASRGVVRSSLVRVLRDDLQCFGPNFDEELIDAAVERIIRPSHQYST